MTAPSAGLTVEQRAALLLQLRRARVQNLDILRAIETAPRDLFTPHRFRDLAQRDIALPIACGQTMPSAADLARRLEALAPQRHHRALEIGTGSGYGTAALARLTREVVSLERFETLAIEAARRLGALGVNNAEVRVADGLAVSSALGLFERILLHVSLDDTPKSLLEILAPDGVIVFGRFEAEADGARRRARLIKLTRIGEETRESDLGPCRLGASLAGVALAM